MEQRAGAEARSKASRRRRVILGADLRPLEQRMLMATFVVGNTGDSGAGSLRRAVHDANTSGGADTIVFDPSVTGVIALTGGELDLIDNVSIVGPGAGVVTISGSNSSRIFEVESSVTASFSGLTLTDGLSVQGGAVRVDSGASLVIQSSLLENNQAQLGGAISNEGTLLIQSSTLLGNSAIGPAGADGSATGGGGGGGGGAGFGGGLFEGSSGTATLVDTTLTQNQATGRARAGLGSRTTATSPARAARAAA